ncbi:Peptidase family M13 containing protein [Aphelenchoides avenae]|nr:Peptidase family M13 containing protein [Aphelenchus avenae]
MPQSLALLYIAIISLFTTQVRAQTPAGYQRGAKLLLDAIDETKDPCENFYDFACGKWRATNTLQPGVEIRASFPDLANEVAKEMEVLLSECSYGGSKAINAVKTLHNACMNKLRFQPRKSYEVIHHLVNFGYWPIIQPKWSATDYDLTQLLIHVALAGASTRLVVMFVYNNVQDSTQKLLTIAQDTPPLGGAYLDSSDEAKKYVESYENNVRETISIIAKDAGSCRTTDEITKDVKDIVDFERRLAEMNEPDGPGASIAQKSNIMKLSELARIVPVIDWQRFCREVFPSQIRSFTDTDPMVNVVHAQYLQKLVQLLQRTSSRTVANYVLHRYVLEFGDTLDTRFDELGDRPPQPRQKECYEVVKELLPQALGAIYVRHHFSQADAQVVKDQMEDLRTAFGNIIQSSTWMDATTRQYAFEKV